MTARKGMQRTCLSAALAVIATTMSAGAAMAIERSPVEEHPLIEKCRSLAMEHSGHELENKQIKASNLPDYEPGQEYELLVSFLGHGNTFHNVTCHISPEGEVSYKGNDQGGLPSVGS